MAKPPAAAAAASSIAPGAAPPLSMALLQKLRRSKWTPFLVMLAIDAAYAVMNILIKKVIDGGTNRLVLITLRQLIAALFLAPIAYFRERKMRPKLTADIGVHLFFSAALGAALTQYLFLVGLQYTSATFACAFANILPVLTFLMALLFRGYIEAFNGTLSLSLAQLGDRELEAVGGDAEGGRRGRVRRRRVGPLAVQRRGADELLGARSGSRVAGSRGPGVHPPAARDGDRRVVRRLPLLRVVVPRAVESREEVPGVVLRRRPHLPHQLPPGRGAEPGRPPGLRHVDSEDQVGDRHGAFLGDRGIGNRVLDHVMVCRGKRAALHRRIHSFDSDTCCCHRHIGPPHSNPPWECFGICSCDFWPLLPLVGQKQGGCSKGSKL